MDPTAVWLARNRDAIRVGKLGRHPDDGRPVLIRNGQFYEMDDLAPGSFVGIYYP